MRLATNHNTEDLRRDKAALLAELQRAGADVSRPKAIKCPWHEDRHPSAAVYQGDDGVWRIKCHGCGAGGDVFDLRAKISGRSVADELREVSGPAQRPFRHTPLPALTTPDPVAEAPARIFPSVDDLRRSDPRVVEVYHYPDRSEPQLVVLRLREPDGRKSFRQAHPVPGGFAYGAPEPPFPLLNRAAVADSDKIIFVEGEKDVATLTKMGFTATTTAGGALKSHLTDLSTLAGKQVTLWPDADDPDPKTGQRVGVRHMRQVAAALQQLEPPPRVLWVDPDRLGLKGGQDVTDLLGQYPGADRESKAAIILSVLAEAEPMGPSAGVKSIIEDAISGRRRNIPLPWQETTRWARAMLPATVTLLVAPPSATKSFWLLQAAAHWHASGEKPAVLELEDGQAFHLRRALAQRSGMADLTNDEWCKANPDRARAAQSEHAAWQDSFGACIHALPGDGQPTFEAVADWIESQAMAGRQVLAVDPLSIAETKRDQFVEDQRFIARVKRTAEQFGCRVLLVMHPRKLATTRTLDDVAGGAAYTRLAHCVLWLQFHPEPQPVVVREPLTQVRVEAEINRTIHILKARNGRGTGWSVGFTFDPATLTFSEQGVITS